MIDAYSVSVDNLHSRMHVLDASGVKPLDAGWVPRMPASKKRSYARYTMAAVELLGMLVQLERKARRMTAQDMADRLGVDRSTLHRLENGDPKVELGLAFEACAILGIPLFEEDAQGVSMRLDEAGKRLALLPRRVRPKPLSISDDF
ncbi:helix-turn-helix transcriptional regulator [Sphingomonas sp. Sph1(2015)]|jgi:transcriptional regulator with XRE-family HTH domain|uniref:helix-turn-helix transcriptional regulator n=1 Tax=Sphingomonas sp. Sph1(2015) TaxID=1628084 RepID=UPI0013017C57|nr:helix-turn-helix transcriptional regulator [Sphingomonas sp. Sph1(2015)]